MSWLFSRALVEAFSEATSSDGEQSVLLSGNPTPQAYLPPDRMTAFSRPSRFGMTFRPLTDELGAAVLTWCLEASRARTSAWQEKAQELTEPDQACGATWRGSLARFDPATSSWRTAQPSLLEDLGESSVIWPRSGMTAGGQCWELPMSGRRISGTGSGLWATPSATDGQRGGTITENMTGVSLAQMVNTPTRWPTPRCHMTRPVRVRMDVEKGHKSNLEEVVAVRATWPTPTAHNAKETNAPSEMERNTPTLAAQAGGSLNPTWVEWLMGWPLGWTDLKPLATDKSHSAQQQHGDY